MAVIPQGIESLYSTILSYLSLLLTIAFFAKIVQLIGGIRGRHGGGGSDGKKPKTVTESDIPEGDGVTPPDMVDKVNKDKFNPYNPAFVRFLVTDMDNNPIKGALITVKPAYARARKWYGRRNKDTWRKYEGMQTNADGYYPPGEDNYVEIGSGVVNIFVKKRGYKLLPRFTEYMKHFSLSPGERKEPIIIVLDQEGGKDEHFEPSIHDAQVKEIGGKEVLHLEGVVK